MYETIIKIISIPFFIAWGILEIIWFVKIWLGDD